MLFLVEAYCKITIPEEGLRQVGVFNTVSEAINFD